MKDDELDFCQYIRNIEKNPKAKQPQLTIGQFLRMQIHVTTCAECDRITQKVLDERPKKNIDIDMSEN